MVKSPEPVVDAHPFWYARVLGIFHARVLHTGCAARIAPYSIWNFFGVRWYGIQPGHRYGFKVARLPKVGFVEEEDDQLLASRPSLCCAVAILVPAFC